MSRRRCPNCDVSKIGRCSCCHGTGYMDMFQDPFSVPVTSKSLSVCPAGSDAIFTRPA